MGVYIVVYVLYLGGAFYLFTFPFKGESKRIQLQQEWWLEG